MLSMPTRWLQGQFPWQWGDHLAVGSHGFTASEFRFPLHLLR